MPLGRVGGLTQRLLVGEPVGDVFIGRDDPELGGYAFEMLPNSRAMTDFDKDFALELYPSARTSLQ